MYELLLSFFIFVTIFIDTLAMLMKGVDSDSGLAKVYVSSQALTYLTRFSLFFILPIVGMILDGFVEFNLWLFFQIFASLLMFHSVFIFFKKEVIICNVKELVNLYEKSIVGFFSFCLRELFIRRNDESKERPRTKLTFTIIVYGISHLFLSFIFPLLLLLGAMYPDIRALFMGMTNVYTGLFSIYITFFIERKIPYLENNNRRVYVSSLIHVKLIFIFAASIFILLFSNAYEFLR